nr:MAG TPA: hypothetical protein [Caudoviricetes sp.]
MKKSTLKCVHNTKEKSRREALFHSYQLLFFTPKLPSVGDLGIFLWKNLTFHLVVSIIYNISHYLFSEK